MRLYWFVGRARALACFGVVAALFGFSFAAPGYSQNAEPAVSCASLGKLTPPDTTITMAQEYATGEFKMPPQRFGPPQGGPSGGGAPQGGPGGGPQGAPGGQARIQGGPGGGGIPGSMGERFSGPIPAFCRVTATLKPTNDSNIRIEVWLPVSGWNGKMAGIGGGGFAGNISYGGLLGGLTRGYAAATTDSGHDGANPDEAQGRFALGHPERVIDYGYRAVHLMTVRAKEITKAYYGSDPRHSYFFGQSRGGYEGLTEARRYPKDYDGIGIGWPPNPFVLFNAAQLWVNWHIAHNPAMLIPQEKYPMMHQAVLDACDELDGVKDGIITEPNYCPFQPRSLLCKGADAPDCLTAPQVELLEKIYQGPTNPRTGQNYFPGPAKGEEMQELWSFANGTPRAVAANMYKYFVFKDENWDWKTLNWDGDVEKALAETREITTDANLEDFGQSGGRLLLYIGWENYHNPAELIGYYKDAVKAMGEANAAKSFRFVTMPGTFQSPPLFDAVSVVEDWVEKGKAPDQILATYTDQSGKVLRTRPLCAYPKVPTYEGTGDTDKAGSFVCAESKFEKNR
jgi:feruloyl esterase